MAHKRTVTAGDKLCPSSSSDTRQNVSSPGHPATRVCPHGQAVPELALSSNPRGPRQKPDVEVREGGTETGDTGRGAGKGAGRGRAVRNRWWKQGRSFASQAGLAPQGRRAGHSTDPVSTSPAPSRAPGWTQGHRPPRRSLPPSLPVWGPYAPRPSQACPCPSASRPGAHGLSGRGCLSAGSEGSRAASACLSALPDVHATAALALSTAQARTTASRPVPP